MTHTEMIQIFASFVGTLCFGVLFRMRGRRLLATAMGGVLCYLIYLILIRYITNEPLVYYVVAIIVSVYSELIARLLKTPATPIVTTALIPLIPGGALYNTMVLAFESSPMEFLEKAVDTISLASAFALGIITVTVFSHVVLKGSRRKSLPTDTC